MKLRNGIRVDTIKQKKKKKKTTTKQQQQQQQQQQKTVSSIILDVSILCNGEDWCKTWFIRREIKMTLVISRHI